MKVLGAGSFAEFAAVRAPGVVVWWNFELARQLGFSVPRTNAAASEFEAHLTSSLSLRAISTNHVQNEGRVKMFADKYGGDGVSPALGAGRAGFVSYGNLYVKGVGFTPLFKHDDPDDFAHSHGEVHMDDCLTEALFGEVNHNLFTRGSARVLAVIDQRRSVTPPRGLKIPVCLVVRAGTQLRPAHLLGSHIPGGNSRLENFLRMARASSQLVTQRDSKTRERLPDVRATMLRVIDDHALTAAESFRWRIIHGALTPSNMDLSGGMLDLPTQSAQPRTAPIRTLNYGNSVFGKEHEERAASLVPVYRALIRHTAPAERDQLNVKRINIVTEMNAAYRKHLEVKLLCATGLKTKLAERLQREQKDVAVDFTDLILRMVALKNSGSIQAWKSDVETVSVLDAFHLFRRFPETYFSNPDADHAEVIRLYLRPVFRGSRPQVARKKSVVTALIKRFVVLFSNIMKCAAGFGSDFYEDEPQMQASIMARAAFENEPLDALYANRLSDDLDQMIDAYRRSGDPGPLRLALNQRITNSLRSVDSLLIQGARGRLADGGLEVQQRTIDGISYAVQAWNNRAQTRRLRVSIDFERSGNRYLSAVPTLPPLTRRQVESLRFRVTTDGWKNRTEAGAQLKKDRNHNLVVQLDQIQSFPLVGRLNVIPYLAEASLFKWKRRNRLSGYVFAIPDRKELISLST